MKAVILKCAPLAQFHFGKTALDVDTSLNDTSEILHSDTLFSALIATMDKTFPNKIKSFRDYFEEGRIKVSSGFYCLEIAGQVVYFLPKPNHYDLEWTEKHKKIRKVQFVSKLVWEKGLTPKEWEKECIILQRKFVIHQSELPTLSFEEKQLIQLYKINNIPKVSVHQLTQENNLYYQTNVQLADNRQLGIEVNLYFLIDGFELLPPEDAKVITTLIEILVDEGIGGERSVGCGRLLEAELKDFEIVVENPTDQHCAVSLIKPLQTELDKLHWYKIISRGGRRTDRFGKLNRVKMLAEGAVVHKGIQGEIVNLHASEPFLRSGKAFCLPIHYKAPAS